MKKTIKIKITSKSKKAALRCATAVVLNLTPNLTLTPALQT